MDGWSGGGGHWVNDVLAEGKSAVVVHLDLFAIKNETIQVDMKCPLFQFV